MRPSGERAPEADGADSGHQESRQHLSTGEWNHRARVVILGSLAVVGVSLLGARWVGHSVVQEGQSSIDGASTKIDRVTGVVNNAIGHAEGVQKACDGITPYLGDLRSASRDLGDLKKILHPADTTTTTMPVTAPTTAPG